MMSVGATTHPGACTASGAGRDRTAAISEECFLLTCADDRLPAILHRPEVTARTGVVIVVGGRQNRVGSHRQFVLLARALAAAGYATLRRFQMQNRQSPNATTA